MACQYGILRIAYKDMVPGLGKLGDALRHAADDEVLAVEPHCRFMQGGRQRRIRLKAGAYPRNKGRFPPMASMNSSMSIGYMVFMSTLPTGKENCARLTATPSRLPATAM